MIGDEIIDCLRHTFIKDAPSFNYSQPRITLENNIITGYAVIQP